MHGRRWMAAVLLLAAPAFAEEPAPKGVLYKNTLKGGVGDLQFSPDGRMLAAAGFNQTITLRHSATGKLRRTLEGHTGRVTCVAWSPDGKEIASGSEDGSIRFWDPSKGTVTASLLNVHTRGTHGTGTTCIGYFPDGKLLYSSGYDPVVQIWDAWTHKLVRSLAGHGDCVCACLSADGSRLATASQDGTAKLWDPESGDVLGEFSMEPPIQASSAHLGVPCFSPDGRRLFAGGGDGRIRSWTIPDRKEATSWKAHGGFICSAEVSPDGGLVVSGGVHPLGGLGAPEETWDNAIRIWDADTGELLLELGGHEMSVAHCHFSKDGSRLATGSWDGGVLVWDLEALELLPGVATTEDMESLWKRLGEPVGPRAWAGVRALAAKPEKALDLIGSRLRPAEADPGFSKKVADLILKLDDDDPEVRDKAQEDLSHLGPRSEAALRKSLEAPPSAEVRMRIREILESKSAWRPVGEEELRFVRALRILENISGETSSGILKELASGDPESTLTALAKETLGRRNGR
ncbi:MAG: WD40 repeat-containing [Planctomycetota bacterium]|nr:MAG: WD40 repeat-containing [Planctomycetota bacterium]